VNFNGTGTVAIRASGNVSSIADNGTGTYTVNFTTAMPDADFCVSPGCSNPQTRILAQTTSTVQIGTEGSTGTASDASIVALSIFR
jgi:hypothetical protein